MKQVVIIFTLALASTFAIGQDVHFSQIWNTPIQINPAQTGLIPGDLRVGLLHRNQWASIASPYKTYSFNGDYKIETQGKAAIGIGLNLYRDVAGDTKLSTTNIQIAVSSVLSLNSHNTISVGIIGGMIQIHLLMVLLI